MKSRRTITDPSPASLGAITSSNGGKSRALDVSVRVGSPKLDNYRRVRGDRGQFTSGALLSFEDNPNAIKRRLWLETDRAYRAAAERLIRIKTNTQVKVAEEDDSDDFSIEKPPRRRAGSPKLNSTTAAVAASASASSRRVSENYPSVLTSHVSVSAPDRHPVFGEHRGHAAAARPRLRAHRRSRPRPRPPTAPTCSTFDTFEAVDAAGLPDDKVIAGGRRPRGERSDRRC